MKLLQRVALILTRTHYVCTIGRVGFSAQPSVGIMRYGSITLKSAVRNCLKRVGGAHGVALWTTKETAFRLILAPRTPSNSPLEQCSYPFSDSFLERVWK